MEQALQFLTKPSKTFHWRMAYRAWLIATIFLVAHSVSAQLNVTLQATSPLCGGFSTGSITATATGSPGPYTYLWNTGATSNPIQFLPVGTYTVTVTSSTGVTGTATATLTSPPPLQLVITVTNCAIPGSMTANVSGGVPPYMYMWDNGATTPTISNLSPGEYCVTIMDSNNCGYVGCQTLGPGLNVQVSTTPIICGNQVGGTATALPSGGDPPFTYLWNTGGTTATIMNLAPGAYTVTVTGDNGCSATASGTVGITAGNFSASLNVTQPTCAGSSTGSITSSVNGGAPPLTYSWSSGQNTQNLSNLPAGQYTLTVTDAFGCSATATASLVYQSNLNVSLNGTNPTCVGLNNGSVTSTVTNGAGPLTYLWNTGATTPVIQNLSAGTYSVTVTDNLNCSKTASITLTAPPSFSVNVQTANASNCGVADGSAQAVTSGGTGPFTYLWSNGSTNAGLFNIPAGTYGVTVTSAQGCTAAASAVVTEPQFLNVSLTGSSHVCGNANDGMLTANVTYGTPPYTYAWSNGSSTQTLINLSPGTYTVTVTSSQGCTGSATKSIAAIPAINLTLNPQSVNCFGTNTGNITASVSGGSPPLTFQWNTGATSQNLNNIPAGTYSLTVTDNAGCSAVKTATVTQPGALSLAFSGTGGSCGSNGSVTVTVTGGISPYTYAWSNGQTTASINNLAPGSYTVTITDANNCTKTGSTQIIAYPLIDLVVSSTNTTCNGTSDGTATATVNGGTPPFQYSWNTGETTATLQNLAPGTYSVTVTDQNGCTDDGSATVLLGAGLNVSIDADTYICPGETGTATAVTAGGTAPYTWLWSNGQTTQTATGLTPGTYSVTVTDDSGCFGSAAVTLLPGGGFTVDATVANATCFGTADGSIMLGVTGGTPPYAFLWNTGATSGNLGLLAAGSYTVTVSDSTGCSLTQSYTISEPPVLQVNLNVVQGNCAIPASATVLPAGGTPPYSFSWSNGLTTPTISNLSPGTYSLTVTDAQACEQVSSFTILALPMPSCSIALIQPVSMIGGTDGKLTAVPSGGTAPYTFAWSTGQTTQTISNLPAGTYEVTVTDANDCETTCSFILYDPAKVGDFVWLDMDEDGIQDAGEAGINGVTVKLTGTSLYGSAISLTTTTAGNGMYMFLVAPGNYKITFTKPAGLLPSPANAGNNDAIDSDANPVNGMTQVFTLAGGETNLTFDAGFFPMPPCENVTFPGTICCDQTLCGPGNDPAPITQTAPATGGIGNLEYLWMFSTVPGPFSQSGWTSINTATGPSYDPGPLYETTYFIRCVRRENCVQFLESNIVTITVDTVAVAQINAPEVGCVNDPIDFTALNNGPGATYSWNFGDGNPATATTPNVNGVTWSGFGLKTVTLTVTRNGCTSTDIHQIYISNLPSFCGTALIVQAEPETPHAVALEWKFPKPDSFMYDFKVEWAWENEDFQPLTLPLDSVIQGDLIHYTTMHQEAKRGMNYYRITMLDHFGNTAVSNVAEAEMIGEIDLVQVYPNPFTHRLTVEVSERSVTLEMYSVEGRLLETYQTPDSGFKFDIPTAALPAGMYYLLVKHKGKPVKTLKLVK